MGGRFEREGTSVYLWLTHVDAWQKPTQYYKAIILQIKTKEGAAVSMLCRLYENRKPAGISQTFDPLFLTQPHHPLVFLKIQLSSQNPTTPSSFPASSGFLRVISWGSSVPKLGLHPTVYVSFVNNVSPSRRFYYCDLCTHLSNSR